MDKKDFQDLLKEIDSMSIEEYCKWHEKAQEMGNYLDWTEMEDSMIFKKAEKEIIEASISCFLLGKPDEEAQVIAKKILKKLEESPVEADSEPQPQCIELQIADKEDSDTVCSILSRNNYWLKVLPATTEIEGVIGTYSDVYTLLVKKD